MKLHYPTTSIAIAAAALPALANSYNVGGPMFGAGRPFVVTSLNGGRCGPTGGGPCGPSISSFRQQRRDWVDNAFEELESELGGGGGFPGNSARRRRSRRRAGSGRVDFESDKEDDAAREKRMEAFRQQQKEQQEMFKKALDLANDVVTGLASDATSSDSDSLKQQKQWLNRAFGIASDVASGRTSPRYEVNNSDDKFQISLDVPGVKLSDIDIRVVDDEERGGNSNAKTLVVQGKRESSLGGDDQKPVEFKKEFSFDASIIDTDTIAAQLNNGVLLVTASKIPKKEPAEKKIQVIQVADSEETEEVSGEVAVEDTTSSKTVELKSNDDNETPEENGEEAKEEEEEP